MSNNTPPGNIYNRVDKIEKDFYFGDGKENPSMTTRMSLIEDIISKLTWVASITLAAVIGEVVLRLMKIL